VILWTPRFTTIAVGFVVDQFARLKKRLLKRHDQISRRSPTVCLQENQVTSKGN
jgi:hypothetical protein